MRTLIPSALLCAALLAPPLTPPLTAQQPDGVLVVTVRLASSGEPLPGAQVALDGSGVGGVTDARGLLRLSPVPAGPQQVRVRSIGYVPAERPVEVTAGATYALLFDLELTAIPLDGVEARARAGLRRLAATGFYDRKAIGVGRFITRADIEKRRPRVLSDMLRSMPGVQLSSTGFSHSHASMRRSLLPGRRCPIQYYLDGALLTSGFNIDDVAAGDVEGLEVYYGPSEIPPAFNRRTAMCGVIVVWTRVD